MIQFGSARIILRDTTFTGHEVMELGWVQSGSIDITYEMAQLWAAGYTFPMDVRYHSGRITGKGAYAKLNALGVAYLIGGSLGTTYATDDVVTVLNTSTPRYWSLEFRMVTDLVDYIVILNRCTSGNMSWEYARDGYVTHSFGFSAFADSNGIVCTIDVGDVS
jgi:hypothetical protein